MSYTAGTILLEAAALCGDRNQGLYTNDKLLPLIKRAVRDLQQAMLVHGIGTVEENHTSSTVAAGGVVHPNPPNDLAVPLQMWERADGSTLNTDWTPMEERNWDPAEQQKDTLEVWKWEDETIMFRGATTARKVYLRYRKALATITDANSAISVVNGENYLASKTASYAARFIGKNRALGADLEKDAEKALGEFLNIGIKEDQAIAVQLKPYSAIRR